ncbi:MAG: 2-amino-4-hydroxy-6-hydroxymethyldihydropteridine diphosphokinase [Gammaproteobacteria bacterium]|nr:2-amino-4-hydroxy-6-hydroxymethyldihydropteridine diphosphokinase [Gammaproteobacteria bacterium]
MNSPGAIINKAISRATGSKARGTIADLPAGTGIPLCLIGLGANLDSRSGSPEATLKDAARELQALSDYPVVISSIWRSSPVDCPPGSPDFANAAVAMLPRSGANPLELLGCLQQIELDFGRVRKGIHNAPRALDLDLLVCGNIIMNTTVLELPHPRLHVRGFVLAPLAEIAPGYVPPGQHLSVEALLEVVERAGESGLLKVTNDSVSL